MFFFLSIFTSIHFYNIGLWGFRLRLLMLLRHRVIKNHINQDCHHKIPLCVFLRRNTSSVCAISVPLGINCCEMTYVDGHTCICICRQWVWLCLECLKETVIINPSSQRVLALHCLPVFSVSSATSSCFE